MKRLIMLFLLVLTVAWPPMQAAEFDRLKMLQSSGRFEELRDEATRMLDTKESIPVERRLKILKYQTDGFMGTRALRECLGVCNDVIETPKPDSLAYYDVRAYICMNDIFCQLNFMESAHRALEKADEVMALHKDKLDADRWKNLESSLLMAKSVLAQSEGDYETALREWNKVEPTHRDDTYHQIAWYGLGGSLYHDMGDTEKAERYFKRALATEGYNPNKWPILLRYMSICINRGDYDEALSLYTTHSKGIESYLNTELRGMIYNAKADALRGLGHYKEASELYSHAINCIDSVGQENTLFVRDLLAQTINPEEYSALKKQIETTREQKQRIAIAALVAGLVLLMILCAVLLLKIRASRRLRQTEEQLTLSDEEHTKEKAELYGELSARESELCNLSMAVSQSESTIITIRSELNRKSVSAEERLSVVESALRESNADAHLRETFKERFDEANQQLYSKLALEHPDLTKAEMNMAAYILLNLNSKEIARMSNRSVRTVDNIKYNLRKKLAVTEPIHVYLRRLVSGR